MRLLVPVLALAAAMLPSPIMAADTSMAAAAMPPTMANFACRKSTDKDTSAMMTQNHEVLATTADGTKLVCMQLADMHDMVMKQKMAASKMSTPAEASQGWVDWTMRYLSVPF